MMPKVFYRVALAVALRRLYNDGNSLTEIAKVSGKHKSEVRRLIAHTYGSEPGDWMKEKLELSNAH